MSNLNISIIGCGVVGVNTALCIQELLPSANITITSSKSYDETTSFGPAGIFRPSPQFRGPSLEVTRKWIRNSYSYYKDLQFVEMCGVSSISGFAYSNVSSSNVRNHFLEELVSIYRNATEEELGNKWKYGSYYETLLIQCNQYLPWVLEKFAQRGGEFEKREIYDLRDHAKNYDVTFNCSGLGAQFLCDDETVVPIRGELVLVECADINHFYYNDYDTYVIPRGDGRVSLGGCRNYDSYEVTSNAFDTASIISRCEKLQPVICTAKFLSSWVGLRPHRPTVRVEAERYDKTRDIVIHHYGHCGYGITSSPGTALYAVQMFIEHQRQRSKL